MPLELDRNETLSRARKLAPVLRERAREGERLRRVPDATIADLIDSGLLRLCQPARFGGAELGWDVLCESSIELAQGDGSQAWVANIYAEHALFAALFEDEAQHEIWDRDPNALLCASIIPQANKAEREGAGFRLRGRWSFASGVHHARWIILGELLGGDPKDHRMFLVPRADYRVDDDWHTLGMLGTGSASVLVDAYVPAHRAVAMTDVNAGKAPGTKVNTGPPYRMPLLGFAQLALAAVPIGVALGMIEDFRQFVAGRGGTAPASGMELLHERFAEAAAATRAAQLLLMDTARQNTALLEAGQALGEDDSLRSQRDGGYAVMLVRRAAMRLFEVTGGHGLYLSAPLQRRFRDILGASAHGSLGWERSALRYAQHALGRQ